jgi:hypothetical protein
MAEAVSASFKTITATANEFNTTSVGALKGLVATGKKAEKIILDSAAGWVPKAILVAFIFILAGIGWIAGESMNTAATIQNTNRAVMQTYEVQGIWEKYLALHPEVKVKELAPIVEPKKP